MTGAKLFQPFLRAATLLVLATAAGGAAAQEPYDPFIGTYVGRAEAVGQNGDTPREVRDLDVLILRTSQGFGIESITVNHHGDRMDPSVRRRSSAMSFAESDIDGIYERDFERDVFARRDEMNLVNGDPLQWARIVDDTLLVYSFVLNEDGSYELHTYRRTRDDTGLALEFNSQSNGEVVREVVGQLVRVEDVMDDINP